MKVLMLEPAGDRVAFDVTTREAQRMILRQQAHWVPGAKDRIARLSSYVQKHPCRTYVSRGGILAAIGRSQVYTRVQASPAEVKSSGLPVFGFKSIYVEDRSYFNAATKMQTVEGK